ncbi:hypothetical protein [Bacillus horti]|uniref:Uncharacterized protein n=1 Tax=Caldalkalibacillus horti TaxID=77523 RepID=A0ABT9VX83_9BACI|nr:hypothetical protein [Bacillus horti]MDQ0165597.1 hypothetical protein [Bacillus horti]
MENDKVKLFALVPLAFTLCLFFPFFLRFVEALEWLFISGFIVFWFWVGYETAQVNIGKLKAFILGSWIWSLMFAMYIWMIVIPKDMNSNSFLATLSILYPMLFERVVEGIYVFIYPYNINPYTMIVLAYLLILLIFCFGFYRGILAANTKRNRNNK